MGAIIGLELRSLWLQGVGENHPNNLPHLVCESGERSKVEEEHLEGRGGESKNSFIISGIRLLESKHQYCKRPKVGSHHGDLRFAFISLPSLPLFARAPPALFQIVCEAICSLIIINR